MSKHIKFGSEVEPLTFNNHQEALRRYLTVILIAIILITDAVTVNLVAYFLLYKDFKLQNIPYSNWYTVTTFVSIVLLISALTIYILPSIPRSKTNNEDLLMRRDFMKIAQELFKPTELKYKINGILRSISYLLGIPIFIANLVLIFVGFFIFYV